MFTNFADFPPICELFFEKSMDNRKLFEFENPSWFRDSRDLRKFWYETLHKLKIAIENKRSKRKIKNQ